MNQTNSKIFKKENFNKIFSVASLIILMVFFTVVNSSFFSAYNIKNILTDMSPLLLMACGVSFILFLGSIDLSIGSIASCAAVMLTFLLDKIGPMAYAVVILYGLAAGLLNGILHTKLKVPSFIATLSTQSIWQSAAYLISGGMPMVMVPAVWPYINWARAGIGFVPLLFLAAVVVLLACYVLQKRMALGRTMLALGTNERAARLIGLEVVKAKIVAFTISGLTAALGGIFFAVKLKSGIPTVGEQYTLMAIASSVLGGIMLTGGKGNVLLTILGVGLITVIQNGMNVIAVDGFWQKIVFGLLVIIAIFMNTDKSRRNLVVK